MVLQSLMGEASDLRAHLFAHQLPPDDYELRVEFNAHLQLSGVPPLIVMAPPVAFRIRPRTVAEEAEVQQLEDLQRMGWDTTKVGRHPRAMSYHPSLIAMVNAMVHQRPDDPFLPFLLTSGMYLTGKTLEEQIVSGKAPRFDPDTSELVTQLRLVVIGRQSRSSSGALLVQELSERHPDQLSFLATQLRGTAAGEMAQYQVERNRHVQQIKQPRPR